MRLKKATINFRCAPRLKQRLTRLAKQKEKTLTEYVREVLEKHVDEREAAQK